jgi:hypothetical protein
VLRLLAAHRNPESYVAGAAPLAREGMRFSSDIDVFHDRENAMQEAVNADTTLLEQNGFGIERRFSGWTTGHQITAATRVCCGASDAL